MINQRRKTSKPPIQTTNPNHQKVSLFPQKDTPGFSFRGTPYWLCSETSQYKANRIRLNSAAVATCALSHGIRGGCARKCKRTRPILGGLANVETNPGTLKGGIRCENVLKQEITTKGQLGSDCLSEKTASSLHLPLRGRGEIEFHLSCLTNIRWASEGIPGLGPREFHFHTLGPGGLKQGS